MGDIAESVLNGDLCQDCGEYIGPGDGYPVSCEACQYDPEIDEKEEYDS